MYRPLKPKMFEPLNPEHSLVDAMTEEMHESESPEVIYWVNKKPEEIDAENQALNPGVEIPGYMDDLDTVYGEKSSATGLLQFREPIQIFGKIDIEPIIKELARMGLITKEEIDFYVNIAHIHEKLNQPPAGGDVFRVTYLIRDQHGDLKEHLVYYKVSTVNPVDLYNYQYVNYQINAEQTNMQDVPDEIKNYYIDNKF